MNKKLVLMGAALLMTAATASAQKRVTGRVLDTNGAPIAGATVHVKGSLRPRPTPTVTSV